jgi:hypothetical protein
MIPRTTAGFETGKGVGGQMAIDGAAAARALKAFNEAVPVDAATRFDCSGFDCVARWGALTSQNELGVARRCRTVLQDRGAPGHHLHLHGR